MSKPEDFKGKNNWTHQKKELKEMVKTLQQSLFYEMKKCKELEDKIKELENKLKLYEDMEFIGDNLMEFNYENGN